MRFVRRDLNTLLPLVGLWLTLAMISPATAADEKDDLSNLFPPLKKTAGVLLGVSDENKAAVVTATAKLEFFPGENVGLLTIDAQVAAEHYIYSLTQPSGGPKRSVISFLKSKDGSPASVTIHGMPRPKVPPKIGSEKEFPNVSIEKHEGTVSWTARVQLPAGFDADPSLPKLLLNGQVCKTGLCKLYNLTLDVTVLKAAQPLPPETTTPSSGAFSLDQIQASDRAKIPFYQAFLIAFVSGFILNFMPCVLPVIGLKIKSFIQQAGQSRRRVFLLNIWYSLGLLTVFMVLATLNVALNFKWGQLNQYESFNIVMVAIVFTMALSFLGVWEIPIPGFVGSSKAAELAEEEGALAAFVKGIITTILAVPCTGPGMTTAFSWATGKPTPIVFAVFAAMGLGMASPYLVIGAKPELARFLPKPGLWMETFKEVLGFVLLATVVFIMSYIPFPTLLPLTMFLFGLWAACWWLARTPATESLPKKLMAWVGAITIGAAVGYLAFAWLLPIMTSRFESQAASGTKSLGEFELPWEKYSPETLSQHLNAGKSVFIDFTATWCASCQVNKAVAMNVSETKKLFEQLGVVPLKADKTVPAPEVDDLLARLGNADGGVPYYAIFSSQKPNAPVTFDGLITTGTIRNKLVEAGVLKGESK